VWVDLETGSQGRSTHMFLCLFVVHLIPQQADKPRKQLEEAELRVP